MKHVFFRGGVERQTDGSIGEDFGELAARHSVAPNAAEGGDLGFFGPGDMVAPVEETVLELAPGQVSGVIPIGDHFMLIQRLN